MESTWILVPILIVGQTLEGGFAVQSVEVHSGEGIPCLQLRNELNQHDNVVACRGSWEGDISSADAAGICRNGWSMCTWEHRDALVKISWYEANHMAGCYAINASHDGITCSSCIGKSPKGEMAAIGADCLAYDKTKASCFGKGRIDASDSRVPQYTPCHHAPWITGVLCCREHSALPKVKASSSVHPSDRVMRGTTVTLHCRVTGQRGPVQYTWHKNGHHVVLLNNHATVTIRSASLSDSGAWNCRANCKYGSGVADSPSVYLKVIERVTKGDADGCKVKSRGRMLASAGDDIALCDGSWSGHVRTASRKLCAKGWKVCSAKDRMALHTFLWEENADIDGCYAYNAASTKYFPCSRCSPRNTGSRMSGIGRACGYQQEAGYSCLGQGRIDVLSKEAMFSKPERALRTCRYTEGFTTGVACCRKTKKRRGVKFCRCKNGGVCSAEGICRCRRGFTGKRCQKQAGLR